MHITRIELENIKSYERAEFEFGRGTTAIMGPNGAGKTTIIEAVAWVMFDLLDYKKEDFLRRGKKKGSVLVEFESGLDERRYVVQRDTRTAYFVYDPRLKTRIADKKEEVTRFLWQHLGVEPGTDLESLFRRAIGVPQGTFTAIFLETPNERKKAFDKLLKVEEYRVGAMRLGRTAKHVENLIVRTGQDIARAEGELTTRDKYKEELKSIKKSGKQLQSSLRKLEKEVSTQRKRVKTLEKTKAAYDTSKEKSERLVGELNRAEAVKLQLEKQVAVAAAASAALLEHVEDYKTHLEALARIKELERERKERDRLANELRDIEKAIFKVQTEQDSIGKKLDEIESKRKTVNELKPKIEIQRNLESERKRLERSVSNADSKVVRIEKLEESLIELRKRHKANDAEIAKLRALKPKADEADKIVSHSDRITGDIVSLQARIERDREFQKQVKDGMCPVFSAKCLNLETGQTLDGFLSEKFSVLESRIAGLKTEQAKVVQNLNTAREAQKLVAGLSVLEQKGSEILKDGKRFRKEQEALKSEVKTRESDKKRLSEVEKQLSELGDPASRAALLEKDIVQVQDLRGRKTKVESNFERLESERRVKVEQIDLYKDLDSGWKEFTAKREATLKGYGTYLKNESLAGSLAENEAGKIEAEKEIAHLKTAHEQMEITLEKIAKEFDPELYKNESGSLRTSEIELSRISADAKHAISREEEIEKELKKLEEVNKKLQLDKKENERLERLSAAVAFVRNTLKAAAPRVAKNYVFHVSVEANVLFREITGNAEVTLQWTDDYGIELEEGGFNRPFVSLSGGEQMSAALAVRLALLRQLSDVRIAFFDEPTTNMDLERRERLAEQISRITENQTFDQLFVVSHDDTFESFADHVVEIGG